MRKWAWDIYLEGRNDEYYYKRELQVLKNLDKRICKIELQKQRLSEIQILNSPSSLKLIDNEDDTKNVANSIKEKVKDVRASLALPKEALKSIQKRRKTMYDVRQQKTIDIDGMQSDKSSEKIELSLMNEVKSAPVKEISLVVTNELKPLSIKYKSSSAYELDKI